LEKLKIGPVTRLNGPLWIELDLDKNKVVDAKISVTAARNFENIISDRDPFDLSFIGQRVCAKCSIGHAVAASSAIESAYNINPTKSGRILRSAIQALDIVASHISSFYQTILPDYLDISPVLQYQGNSKDLLSLKSKISSLELKGDVAPFSMENPGDRINNPDVVLSLLSHYLDSFKVRSRINKLLAVFTGKIPHPASIVPGGITVSLGIDQLRELIFQLRDVAKWVDDVFLSDTLDLAPSLLDFGKIGTGSGNFLSFGGLAIDELGEDKFFPRGLILEKDLTTILNLELEKIVEETKYSWYTKDSGNRHPQDGRTVFDTGIKDAYSFVKAPRYRNRPMETGPLARLLIKGNKTLLKLANDLRIGPSVLSRIISYSIETKSLIEAIFDWISQVKPGQATFVEKKPLPFAESYGLSESPSGAIGYWIKIEDSRLASAQIISGSSWTLSPKSKNTRGPIEEALVGLEIPDKNSPIDALRVIRSFAPCPVCASH
jgi:hydrogenase large subunit